MASEEAASSKQDEIVMVDSTTQTDYLKKSYEKSHLRVSKDTLYMIIALWIEDFVDDDEAPEKSKQHNVGAVLVSPNDVILTADCSRDEVHAAARLLIKHSGKTEGCKMFMSRKPCPLCAKLLVQSKVKRVFFLPTREPEYYRSPEKDTACAQSQNDNTDNDENKKRMKEVEIMFTASAIAQTKFVLRVEKPVGDLAKELTPDKKVEEHKRSLIAKYMPEKWDKETIKEYLPWPSYDDKMHREVHSNFEDVMEWVARVFVMKKRELDKFIDCTEKAKDSKDFNPVSNPDHRKIARLFLEIARLLAQRTDDPTTGVGAVIVSQEMEVLAFGWNGYPFGAQYGEFARASQKDNQNVQDKTTKIKQQRQDNKVKTNLPEEIDEKYPYVIHAEQNALLMRNSKNLKNSILFVTRCPCDECTPLLAMEGIQTVIADDDIKFPTRTTGYEIFPEMVKDNKFVCYETTKSPDPKNIPASSEKRKNLQKIE
ncbi:cytidine and dCMP deaminase domain-containing protein 1-like [Dendronephthya gigantea]|uniref:cytidine and dCMP deaminase domain-containing protein 1-like n=1 Tax=Dendronephthya gigantea TaxID=151771 RepID=UPI00106B01B0|nr:cytidine and dCMP deaminase domain-containing protein 1-like [Dendronephthya gigantea]